MGKAIVSHAIEHLHDWKLIMSFVLQLLNFIPLLSSIQIYDYNIPDIYNINIYVVLNIVKRSLSASCVLINCDNVTTMRRSLTLELNIVAN